MPLKSRNTASAAGTESLCSWVSQSTWAYSWNGFHMQECGWTLRLQRCGCIETPIWWFYKREEFMSATFLSSWSPLADLAPSRFSSPRSIRPATSRLPCQDCASPPYQESTLFFGPLYSLPREAFSSTYTWRWPLNYKGLAVRPRHRPLVVDQAVPAVRIIVTSLSAHDPNLAPCLSMPAVWPSHFYIHQ